MVWKERLCALQAPVAFGALNGSSAGRRIRKQIAVVALACESQPEGASELQVQMEGTNGG
jgi:hypothetical protein